MIRGLTAIQLIGYGIIALLIQTSCSPFTWESHAVATQTENIQFDRASSLIATSDGDIWAVVSKGPSDSWLIRYTPASQNMRIYVTDGPDGKVVPLHLMLSPNGTLWGWDLISLHQPPQIRWRLSRYDSHTDRFFVVQDETALLRGQTVHDLAEDSNRNLWIILGNDSYHSRHELIHYNPISNRATQINLKPRLDELSVQEITRLAIAPDDTIWLVGSRARSGEGTVLQYNPITDTVKDYGAPPKGISYVDRLYFDRAGNLWTSSVARMTLSPTGEAVWELDIQPDEFIAEIDKMPKSRMLWVNPFSIYESSDGKMWFSSLAGLVMYDPPKNIWRRVNDWTSSRVMEDGQQRMWTAANSAFYSYALK